MPRRKSWHFFWSNGGKKIFGKRTAASAALQAFWPMAKTLPQGEFTSPEDVKSTG